MDKSIKDRIEMYDRQAKEANQKVSEILWLVGKYPNIKWNNNGPYTRYYTEEVNQIVDDFNIINGIVIDVYKLEGEVKIYADRSIEMIRREEQMKEAKIPQDLIDKIEYVIKKVGI